MRHLTLIFALLFMTTLPAAAQDFGPQPDAQTRSILLKDREDAWRAWFSNNRPAFTKLVPHELLAIGWDGGEWSDRIGSMANMEKFAKSGQKVSVLEFPRTVFQKYGDVVIMYSTFRIVMTATDGKSEEIRGRGTEVFVWRGGRWAHTAWHLDKVAN